MMAENMEKVIHDGAFWVKKQPFGTFVSVRSDGSGTELITSLTEELCIEATRFYLKFKQESAVAD